MRGEPQRVGVGLRRMRELVEFFKDELRYLPAEQLGVEAHQRRQRAYEDTIALLRALDPER